jgi:hypothetical protein
MSECGRLKCPPWVIDYLGKVAIANTSGYPRRRSQIPNLLDDLLASSTLAGKLMRCCATAPNDDISRNLGI